MEDLSVSGEGLHERIVTTCSEQETRLLGREIAARLAVGSVVALSGELGTGKTTLARSICGFLDCEDQVTSPTFTIINEYDGSLPVYHCDLYRLHAIDEMVSVGMEDVFASDHVVLVEWAERAMGLLPVPRIEIICAHTERESEREYTIRTVSDDSESMLAPIADGVSAYAATRIPSDADRNDR
jgi:tRNA threonylcarbamoyladenosine biosynthesis protein TsaE